MKKQIFHRHIYFLRPDVINVFYVDLLLLMRLKSTTTYWKQNNNQWTANIQWTSRSELAPKKAKAIILYIIYYYIIRYYYICGKGDGNCFLRFQRYNFY